MRNVRHDSGSGLEDFVGLDKNFTKGPWTTAEDDLLIAYVDKHGDGNWNAVQKHSGLSRCGKSCRLRWVNHLRPDLKKGAFTDKEEKRVIELHAAMGNKWARMAVELPGRTDNEIKNFWNTRLKRLQRQGLPIYPDDIRQQAMNAAAMNGHSMDSLDGHHSQDSMEADTLEIPQLNFELLQLDQCSPYYKSVLRNISMDNLMRQKPCFFRPTNNMYNLIAPPYMPNRKRYREPETAPPFMDGYATNQESSDPWNYPLPDSIPEHFSIVADNHLLGNATYSSASQPLIQEAEKLELPSFQYFDGQEEPTNWGFPHSNPFPALDSDNTLIHSPLTDQTPSSFYDGLLESVVYGSSGEKPAMDTDSDSPLLQSSLLGHTELTPANANTTGHNSNFETDFRHLDLTSSSESHTSFENDWIRKLLGEDREDTK